MFKSKDKFIVEYPTHEIKNYHFKLPDEITHFLDRHALALGFQQEQLFERNTHIEGKTVYYLFTCIKRTCNARLLYKR